jgi:hypothetical protein
VPVVAPVSRRIAGDRAKRISVLSAGFGRQSFGKRRGGDSFKVAQQALEGEDDEGWTTVSDGFCWRLVDVGASSSSLFPGNGARKIDGAKLMK